jgi:hypothetical protein
MATLVFLYGGVYGCVAAEEREERPLKIARVEMSGLNARGVKAGEYVFGEPEDWEEFWRKHGRDDAPEIDFEKYSLVAVFLGAKPNPGYSVGIVGARESAGEAVVDVVEYTPEPGMMYAQVIVYPFDAALIPTTDGSIRFATSKKIGRP